MTSREKIWKKERKKDGKKEKVLIFTCRMVEPTGWGTGSRHGRSSSCSRLGRERSGCGPADPLWPLADRQKDTQIDTQTHRNTGRQRRTQTDKQPHQWHDYTLSCYKLQCFDSWFQAVETRSSLTWDVGVRQVHVTNFGASYWREETQVIKKNSKTSWPAPV